MDLITFRPIGIISTPFQESKGTPIQPKGAEGAVGAVKVFPEFVQGLQDLDGFSHLFLLYHFHRCRDFSLLVKPFLDEVQRGVFATRAPARPNPIGLSIVRLNRIEADTLHVLDVDMLDGTPLLDIKPFVPQFDARDQVRIGWLTHNLEKLETMTDDGRFLPLNPPLEKGDFGVADLLNPPFLKGGRGDFSSPKTGRIYEPCEVRPICIK
jgi:tRNA (adenine37-N6)-methyltransferase